jgi:hypothetical protein
MKRDRNNPEELRQEILLHVEEGRMRPWARRVANGIMFAAGCVLWVIVTAGRAWKE